MEGCDCWGNCEVGVPVNCNDGDPCTRDTCVDDRIDPPGTGYGAGHCEHQCVPSPTCVCPECLWPSDCDDGDACTVDDCDAFGQCVYMDLDCNDHDVCTDDSCDSIIGCINTPIPGCCSTNADCNDGILCTTDTCNFSTHACENRIVAGYCLIGGVCYTSGTINPANACESCQYLFQNDRWSGLPAGTACDDGEFCTADSVCDGDGNCIGAGNPCNDGLACTDDLCNEATDTCSYPVRDTWCLIGGRCWVDYEINPANECQRCLSTTSKTAWSGVPAGTACDDELYCTAVDQCNGLGSCVGAGNPCDDLIECTDNMCVEATDGCTFPVSANRCYIDGVCYTHHDLNLIDNICQWCDSTLLVNRTVWSNRPAGADCDDGLFCNGTATCDGSGTCVAVATDCTDAYGCTTDDCDETGDICTHTIDAGYCLITGRCYMDGELNPANDCLLCNDSVSQTLWSNVPAGTACDDSLFCTAVDQCNGIGSCMGSGNPCDDGLDCTSNVCMEPDVCNYPVIAGQCLIGGVCYATGEDNPLNNCQWCQPAASQTAWTDKPAGTDCDDGAYCNGTATCDGGGTCVAVATDCSDAYGCTTDGCDETADTCTHTIDAGFCLILGACYPDGFINLANDCLMCDDSVSQTLWSNVPAGTACDDGLFCTAVDQCNGTGSCMGAGNPCDDFLDCTDNVCMEPDVCSYPVVAGRCLIDGACYNTGDDNLSNICQWCQPSTSQTAWTNKPAGTACTTDSIACTDDVCDGSGACTHDVAAGQCLIDGACYGEGVNRPGNVCQWCHTATSQTAWTSKADGTACTDDTIACTVDVCTSGACTHDVAGGWCLIGGMTCVLDGTVHATNPCLICNAAAFSTGWSNQPYGTPCTADTHDCTLDICDGAGLCIHDPTPPANDTCAAPSALAASGSGLGMIWTGSGDSFCALDDYSGTCGGAGGPDLVYSFDVPREYAIYRYKFEVAGPAPFDPLAYIQAGTAIAPSCGVYNMIVECNDNGAASCWSLPNDANDVCRAFEASGMPEGTNYLIADSAAASGDVHDVRISRMSTVNNNDCVANLPEVQMGGTFCASTASYTSPLWYYGIYFCNESFGSTQHLGTNWTIDHQNAPFNVSRGYVLSTQGTDTPGGFDNVIWLLSGSCSSTEQQILGCDGWGNAMHWSKSPASGWGDRMATGIIPAGWFATVDVSSYWRYGSSNAYRGQYCLTVEVDSDGDGIPDASDGSGLMQGATSNLSGGDGAKVVGTWPYSDANNSYYYPNNSLTALPGKEVYYAYTNTVSGARLKIDALPRLRGDYFSTGSSGLYDVGVWIYFPQAGRFCCLSSGNHTCEDAYGRAGHWTCTNVAAGTWNGCEAWGAGWDECAYVDGAANDTYIFAVDGYTASPAGGWYTVRLYNADSRPFPP